jgi:hypothetical protein
MSKLLGLGRMEGLDKLTETIPLIESRTRALLACSVAHLSTASYKRCVFLKFTQRRQRRVLNSQLLDITKQTSVRLVPVTGSAVTTRRTPHVLTSYMMHMGGQSLTALTTVLPPSFVHGKMHC